MQANPAQDTITPTITFAITERVFPANEQKLAGLVHSSRGKNKGHSRVDLLKSIFKYEKPTSSAAQ
jgi:hypothetical protein